MSKYYPNTQTRAERYHQLTAEASHAEQTGNYLFGQKMWLEAQKIAMDKFWLARAVWCKNRAHTCVVKELRTNEGAYRRIKAAA